MAKNILPTPEPDNDLWEQRRYELAKAALIGLSGKAMPIEVAAREAATGRRYDWRGTGGMKNTTADVP